MCGRYTLVAGEDELIAEFDLTSCDPVTPNRNICPTQSAPVVRQFEDGKRRLSQMRWGLIPFWSKDPTSTYKMINARSEEAEGRPAFREAIRRRRCLVPCSGFYEWKAMEGASKSAKKQPFVFERDGGGLFALAGLWERWQAATNESLETFTILTTAANELVAPIHNRMPVVMSPSNYWAWLDPTMNDAAQVRKLLLEQTSRDLSCHAIDRVG